MRSTAALFLLLIFAACSTRFYVPSDANVNKRETASLAELQQGHDIFMNHCGKCHKLKKPDSHSPQEWTKVLEKMGPKAKLNQDQVSLVYKYVVNY